MTNEIQGAEGAKVLELFGRRAPAQGPRPSPQPVESPRTPVARTPSATHDRSPLLTWIVDGVPDASFLGLNLETGRCYLEMEDGSERRYDSLREACGRLGLDIEQLVETHRKDAAAEMTRLLKAATKRGAR